MSPASQQTATIAKLVITDGTAENTASLLVYTCGAHLKEWNPRSPNSASSIWASSPYQNGKHLISKTYDNILDAFTVIFNEGNQDETIKSLRRFIELLEKGTDYWVDEFNTNKFWLEARSPYETNIRYAIVVDYQIPEINNPYHPTFGANEESTLDDIQLNIEHTIWTDNLEIGSDCVQFSTGRYDDYWALEKTFIPTQSEDDAYTIDPAGYSSGAVMLDLGSIAGQIAETGIRFRSVTVPKNATIHRAWITFQSQNNDASDVCNVKIYGELNAAPAVFASYADLKGRTRTSNNTAWSAIPHWVLNSYYDTPSFADVVKEIVDLAGWVNGNNLVIFLVDNGSTAAAMRHTYSFDGAGTEPVLHIQYSDASDQIYHGEFTPTCERTPAVTNYWRKKSLTHVFLDDGGVFGVNLVDNNLAAPVQLLPAVPAVNDALYCGMSEGSSSSSLQTFNTLVLELSRLGVDITTIALEYWNGAWIAPGVITYEPANWTWATTTLGVHIIKWRLPSDWIATTINAITGLWVRFRVTATGVGPVGPQQLAGKPIYSIGWGDIKINSQQVKGDISGIINFLLSGSIDILSKRIFISSRREDRMNSDKFVPYIPLTSITSHLPDDVRITLGGGAATLATSPLTPARTHTNFTTAGAAVAAIADEIAIGPKTYAGRYRVFLRIRSSAGTDAGEVGAFLRIQSMLGTYDTATVYNTNLPSTCSVMDLGIISLPSDYLYETDSPIKVMIYLYILATAAINVDLYDLTLMPVDEAHLELELMSGVTGLGSGWDQPYKVVTSNVKTGAYCFEIASSYTGGLDRTVEWNYAVISYHKVNILGCFELEPNTEYRLFFYWFDIVYNTDDLFTGYQIPNMDVGKRYLFLRGDE